MRLYTIIATLLFAFTAQTTSAVTIKNCDPTSVFLITTLSLTPDQPVSGDIVKLSLIFDNHGAPITDGTVTNIITLNGLPFNSESALCSNTECPIVTGSNDRSTQNTWPSVSGTLNSKIVWTGPNDETLLCIQMKVTTENEKAVIKRLRGELVVKEIDTRYIHYKNISY